MRHEEMARVSDGISELRQRVKELSDANREMIRLDEEEAHEQIDSLGKQVATLNHAYNELFIAAANAASDMRSDETTEALQKLLDVRILPLDTAAEAEKWVRIEFVHEEDAEGGVEVVDFRQIKGPLHKPLMLEHVYGGCMMRTAEGNTLAICMRDDTYELRYNNREWFRPEGMVPAEQMERLRKYVRHIKDCKE